MIRDSKVFVAGHRGLVGAAIVRRLAAAGYSNLVTKSHAELDLTNQLAVENFFTNEHPDYVFLAAAKVGGIMANRTYPADFIRINLAIQSNVIDAAYRHGVKKLLFLGSSCIYPKDAPQPINEEHLLTGPLETTNEWYAIAKIAGLKMCQAYRNQYGFKAIAVMPTNLYGPGDNFDLETSHVLPALVRKFHEAKVSGASQVAIWGTGRPRREFLHVDDLADACLFLMQNYDSGQILNVGVGRDIRIRELANLIAKTVGYDGEIVFDATKPDGTPMKLLDTTRLSELGWGAAITLPAGIQGTYQWYLENVFKSILWQDSGISNK
jgi:GDP-L-fucose synthase